MNSFIRERLKSLPWCALEGIGPLLAPALDSVLNGAAADSVLFEFLRGHCSLTAAQRHICSESILGVGLWRRRVRAQIPRATSLQLLAALATDLGATTQAAHWLGVTLPLLSEPFDWRDASSLPDWLADEMVSAVGTAEATQLADAFNVPGPVTIRCNSARGSRDVLATLLEQEGRTSHPGRWCSQALHVLTRPANLTATQAWRDGWFEIQDEGSQLLAMAVPAQPNDVILDLCAGAGGKTLALSSRFPSAELHAVDVDAARLDRLRGRAARATATISVHGSKPPHGLRANQVLVDAPCSELGALRRGPDRRWRLDPAQFAQWPAIQLGLLELAVCHLRPGGSITYATCTFRRQENQGVIEAFLERHPDFSLEPIALSSELLNADGTLQLFPHRHGTDGFFAAVLRSKE